MWSCIILSRPLLLKFTTTNLTLHQVLVGFYIVTHSSERQLKCDICSSSFLTVIHIRQVRSEVQINIHFLAELQISRLMKVL